MRPKLNETNGLTNPQVVQTPDSGEQPFLAKSGSDAGKKAKSRKKGAKAAASRVVQPRNMRPWASETQFDQAQTITTPSSASFEPPAPADQLGGNDALDASSSSSEDWKSVELHFDEISSPSLDSIFDTSIQSKHRLDNWTEVSDSLRARVIRNHPGSNAASRLESDCRDDIDCDIEEQNERIREIPLLNAARHCTNPLQMAMTARQSGSRIPAASIDRQSTSNLPTLNRSTEDMRKKLDTTAQLKKVITKAFKLGGLFVLIMLACQITIYLCAGGIPYGTSDNPPTSVKPAPAAPRAAQEAPHITRQRVPAPVHHISTIAQPEPEDRYVQVDKVAPRRAYQSW